MKQPEMLTMSEDWLSLDETMNRLGRSQRRIQEYVKKKHLKLKRIPRPGRQPEPVYWAKDVERLLAEGIPR